MTLGLPRGVALRVASRALSDAALALGAVALLMAALLIVLRDVNHEPHNTWPAVFLLVPIAVLMIASHARPGLALSIMYLVVGELAIGGYALVVLANAPDALAVFPFILALPQIAVVFTLTPTQNGVRAIVFVVLAYVLGQSAVLAAAVITGRHPGFDALTLTLGLTALALPVSNLFVRRRARSDQQSIVRAHRDANAVAYQRELESQVIALFHDTVLSELTVLSHQPPSTLSRSQAQAIRRDLEMIDAGAWWPDDDEFEPVVRSIPEHLAQVLEEAESNGLDVEVSGDGASLHRLRPATLSALGLAVRQALVNVLQHSGTDRAEIAIQGAPDAVVLMLSDGGRGFDENAVPADRLGLAQSIRGRIQDAGGQVQLWTAPGSGTAYMFTLPVDGPDSVQRGVRGDQAREGATASENDGEPPLRRSAPSLWGRATGILRWRGRPQRHDPIGARAIYPLTVASALAAVAYAILRTVLSGQEVVGPTSAIGAILLVVVAAMIVIVSTDPIRTPVSTMPFAAVVVLAWCADICSSISMWGADSGMWHDWGPVVAAVLIVAFAPHRSGRDLLIATAATTIVVGSVGALNGPVMPMPTPPAVAALIAATPVLMLGVAAAVFSYRDSRLSVQWGVDLDDEQRGRALRIRIRLRQLMREIGRDALSAELVPFLEDVLARGAVTEADNERARRMSAQLRAAIIRNMGLPWLARLSRAHPDALVVSDEQRIGDSFDKEQTVALWALVTALVAAARPGDRVHVAVEGTPAAPNVSARVPYSGSETALRARLGTFVAVMNSVFGRSSIAVEEGELRMRFSYASSSS